MSFGDIGMITYKNAPCVLSFLKHRYVNSQIYVRLVLKWFFSSTLLFLDWVCVLDRLDWYIYTFPDAFIFLTQTTADPLLVAINPYKDLGNTTDAVIKQYHDIEDVSKMPPHVFTTARVALDNLHQWVDGNSLSHDLTQSVELSGIVVPLYMLKHNFWTDFPHACVVG